MIKRSTTIMPLELLTKRKKGAGERLLVEKKLKKAKIPVSRIQHPWARYKFIMQAAVSLLVISFSMAMIWKRPDKDQSVSYSLISSILGFWLPTPGLPRHITANDEDDHKDDEDVENPPRTSTDSDSEGTNGGTFLTEL